MNSLKWPIYNPIEQLSEDVTWKGEFSKEDTLWGNPKFASVRKAIDGPCGAIKLFENNHPREDFRERHGTCKLFAFAHSGHSEVLVMVDKETIYLIDLAVLGGDTLKVVDFDRLRTACNDSNASKMSLEEYRLYKQPPTASGPAPRQPDPLLRTKVEQSAVVTTTAYYENLGFRGDSVEKDNVGWDLDAVQGDHLLKLEVKGLSGSSNCVELTPNEYEKLLANRDNYRVCVVNNALTEPALSIFAYSRVSKLWENEFPGGRGSLVIEEMVAARCRVE